YPLHEDFIDVNTSNLEDGNTIENIRMQGPEGVEYAHRALLASDVHRVNIFSKHNEQIDEAGMGVYLSPDDVFVQGFANPFREFYTQEFAHDDNFTPHVLGVAYRDMNGDKFFQVGEELPGVAVGTTDGLYAEETAPGGGYGMRIDDPGDYTLRASGPGLDADMEIPFTIQDRNVKVDFVQYVEPSFDLKKVFFRVNIKKRAKGNPFVDVFKLKAKVDTNRLPEGFEGLTVTIRLGDLVFGPYALDGPKNTGSFKSQPKTQPRISLKLQKKSGKLVFKILRADLMEGLKVVDETVKGTKDLTLDTVVGNRFDVTRDLTFQLKSKHGKKAIGRAP
ncbi:MAG: CAP domain-containing protein, partial [Planctomycetota bacterium]